jgi:hypothetical protein
MRKLNFFTILLLLFSCGEDENKLSTAEKKIEAQANLIYDSIRNEKRNSFYRKYNPNSYSDSTFKYTYQLQELIKSDNGFCKIKGNIIDIIKMEDYYLIEIVGVFSNHISFVKLSMDYEMVEKINESIKENSELRKAEFIFVLTGFNASSGFKANPLESNDSGFEIRYDFIKLNYFIEGILIDFLP